MNWRWVAFVAVGLSLVLSFAGAGRLVRLVDDMIESEAELKERLTTADLQEMREFAAAFDGSNPGAVQFSSELPPRLQALRISWVAPSGRPEASPLVRFEFGGGHRHYGLFIAQEPVKLRASSDEHLSAWSPTIWFFDAE